MKHTFFLKKPKSNEKTLILFTCYFKDEAKKFVYSTGEVIEPKYWNATEKMPYKSGRNVAPDVVSILEQLNRYSSVFYKVVERFKLMEQTFTASDLKNEFNKEFKKFAIDKNQFYQVFEEFINQKKGLREWKPSTKKRYDYLKTLLEDFEEKENYKISFNTINEKFYNKFLEFCYTTRNHYSNTVARNVGLLKTFLNWSLEQRISFRDDFRKFKTPKKVITRQEALSLDQLNEIISHKCSSTKLERVRDIFIFQCFTGMRYNELFRISPRTVYKDYLILKEEKDSTKKDRKIPLTDAAKFILRKYKNNLPLISNQKQNEYIKNLLKEMEYNREVEFTKTKNKEQTTITKNFFDRISTHTARRTFITLMRNNKVPIKSIMAITGHKDIKIIESYYSVNDDTTKDAVIDTFKTVEIPVLKKA
ncbi:integrase [Paucihalobacter ruber]|uniref:Integrase n=1 Tax=Paucihalobacter ruber TaxID=2567861 RepID=A0A506PHY6_9FLAO|nr:tyrosine-type recombinase/integrase [Paucihalobacter ruber]TPV33219.1 integrase [Paucihalobacter ruber]